MPPSQDRSAADPQPPGNFYTSYKLSLSFKVCLLIFVSLSIVWLTYAEARQGEDWKTLLIGTGSGVALVYWLITTMARRIRNPNELSTVESSYIEDLSRLKVVSFLRAHVFSEMNLQDVLRFIVILGYLFKWFFFYIFVMGSTLLLIRQNALLDRMFMLALAITWCPWIEDMVVKTINYKIVFALKVALTITLFAVGVASNQNY